ncbi:hypothetical protein UY3_12584 [Chelonia mydas]|uniref:Uncharacterized protein n=1 Tax=Chelonia mydas TaxID=8469 RepID=M7AZW5_CHEMY|nr:hypothetical protein UY3_12584 [Chelonia mydas]
MSPETWKINCKSEVQEKDCPEGVVLQWILLLLGVGDGQGPYRLCCSGQGAAQSPTTTAAPPGKDGLGRAAAPGPLLRGSVWDQLPGAARAVASEAGPRAAPAARAALVSAAEVTAAAEVMEVPESHGIHDFCDLRERLAALMIGSVETDHEEP